MQYKFFIAITLLSLVGCKNSQNNNTLLKAESAECKELALRQPGLYDVVCGGETAQESDDSKKAKKEAVKKAQEKTPKMRDSAKTERADPYDDSAAKDVNAEAASGTPTLFDNMFEDSAPDNTPDNTQDNPPGNTPDNTYDNNYENVNEETASDPFTEASPDDIFGGPSETQN